MCPSPSNPIIARTGSRTVEGLGGWQVEESFPHYAVYRHEGREFRISAEMSTGPGTSIILYDESNDPHWEAPYRDVPLDAVTAHQILVRVTASMILLGIQPIWEAYAPQFERKDWPVIWEEARALVRRADG